VQRISVVGSSGSGKTKIASAIAARLYVPHLELDSVYHQAHWTPLPATEFRARVAAYVAQPSWVIDGNYEAPGVLDLVWQCADTVVWLDPPRGVVLWQVLSRSLVRGLARTELWNGNRERLGQLLRADPHENVVLWAMTRFDTLRDRYASRMRDPAWSHLTFHRLGSRAEQRTFLTSLREHA
jgi:adenylate kinase family enzyme